MKIEKLYTLSQFVELVTLHEDDCFINSDIIKEAKKTGVLVSGKICETIYNYNNFLKQPLTKQMFVNETAKPEQEELKGDSLAYGEQLDQWQKYEKKVIFEGFEKHDNCIGNNQHPELEIIIKKSGFLTISSSYSESFQSGLLLSDLAEKTNGQLKLKNVEI